MPDRTESKRQEVAIDDVPVVYDPRQLGLETWTIPGGLYVREKMRDWENRIADIGKTFIAMTERRAIAWTAAGPASSSTKARASWFSCSR